MSAFSLRHVAVRPRSGGALVDASLAVDEGELVVVTGPPGAGKTALCRLVTGQARADSGVVTLFGRDVGRLRASAQPYLRRLVTGAPQVPAIVDDLTVCEQLAIPLEVRGVALAELGRRVRAVLAALGLEARGDVRGRELTPAERRLVAVGSAAIPAAPVLVLDDPTADLDAEQVGRVLALTTDLRAAGTTLLVATSVASTARAFAAGGGRVVALEAGRLHAPVAPPAARRSFVPALRAPAPADEGDAFSSWTIEQTDAGLGPVRPPALVAGASR